jgi:hypothetical protein
MNPFRRAILKRVKSRGLKRFTAHWDRLESLVIGVYKQRSAGPAEEAEYRTARAWLLKNYSKYRPALQPYWQATRVAGEAASEDPFEDLLATPLANGFVGNWRAMQTLPAAREALNEYLVDSLPGE